MSGRNQGTLFGDMGGVDAVIRQLREAGEDSSVKAIVLRVNTPGGSVPATQELGTEITRIRVAGKPIVTSMGDVAASGGYWLAAMTDKVYANPSTMTGSIMGLRLIFSKMKRRSSSLMRFLMPGQSLPSMRS